MNNAMAFRGISAGVPCLFYIICLGKEGVQFPCGVSGPGTTNKHQQEVQAPPYCCASNSTANFDQINVGQTNLNGKLEI